MNLKKIILEKIQSSPNQIIPFDLFMDLALYHPDPESPGYYLNPKINIGPQGDFITSPEISDLFGLSIAESVSSIFKQLDNQNNHSKNILELGAGSGKLAIDILRRLKDLDNLPDHYFILERSGVLKNLQYHNIKKAHPELIHQIIWLDNLEFGHSSPPLHGVILANEVCDALAVKLFKKINSQIFELGVDLNLSLTPIAPDPELLKNIENIESRLGPFENNYQSECCLVLKPWLSYLNNFLDQGCILLIDYGYTEQDYYTPSRSTGTLLCYEQHKAYDNPFINIGQRDITAHVNFSQIAEIGVDLGLDLLGYCTQMMFLASCKIDQLEKIYPEKNTQALKMLMHPDLMGEQFKIIGLGKNLGKNLDKNMDKNTQEENLTGFNFQDCRHRL